MSELKDKHIPEDKLIHVCKYRRGELCCKYIAYMTIEKDFVCVKNIPDLKEKVDSTEMLAKGNNCDGL